MQNNSLQWSEYLKWFKQNGGFIDNLELAEKNGVRGLYATQPIKQNKIIVAIPNNLVITTQLVDQSSLKDIIKSNPGIYDIEQNSEGDYNKLSLFVLQEKQKGEKSFYWPMFAMTPNSSTILSWSQEELKNLNDPYIIKDATRFQSLMSDHWDEVLKIMKISPKLFINPDELKQDYYWSYQYVMTRIFCWKMPSSAVLLPIAEFQNHKSGSSEATDHICFNRNYEESPAMIGSKNYQLKSQYLDTEIIRTFKSSQQQQKTFTQNTDDKETYINNNKHLLKESYLNRSEAVNLINFKKVENQESRQIFEEEFYSSSDEEDNDSDDGQYDYEEDEKSDSRFAYRDKDTSWYSHSDPSTYFCVVSSHSYQKNDQIFCSYGRRNSRYLLKWYGFVESDSNFDSFQFQMFVQERKSNFTEAVFIDFAGDEEYVEYQGKKIPIKMLSKNFRLKKNSLNEDLMIYIRNILCDINKQKLQLLSMPSNIELEIEMMTKMQQIVTKLKVSVLTYQDKNDKMKASEKIAEIYCQNRQNIIENQTALIETALKVLQQIKQGIPFKQAYMKNIHSDFKQQILNLCSIRNYIRQLKVGLNIQL